MAPLPEDFSYDHYSAVYNALSFGAMGSFFGVRAGKLTTCMACKGGRSMVMLGSDRGEECEGCVETQIRNGVLAGVCAACERKLAGT